MILGLDISTSITGLAIVDKSGKLLYTDHIDTRKEKNIFDKANKVRASLLELKNSNSIEHIFIEQPFTFFNQVGHLLNDGDPTKIQWNGKLDSKRNV